MGLKEKLLTDPQHLKYTILVLSRDGISEEVLKRYREQISILEAMHIEVAAFVLNIEQAGLQSTDESKYCDRIDVVREQCLKFLELEKRELAKESLNKLRSEHRAFRMAMGDRKARRV